MFCHILSFIMFRSMDSGCRCVCVCDITCVKYRFKKFPLRRAPAAGPAGFYLFIFLARLFTAPCICFTSFFNKLSQGLLSFILCKALAPFFQRTAGDLMIRNIQLYHAGKYICVVDTDVESLSAVAILIVKGKKTSSRLCGR